MSSTSRGGARETDDFYSTPEWCTRLILPKLAPFKTMIEPGCGTGAIARVVKSHSPDVQIFGADISNERLELARPHLEWNLYGSFLDWFPWTKDFDIVLGNPPYELALDFIRHSLGMCNRVVFLLRVNFLASKERASFHREHPSHLHILPRRPSFARSVKCERNSRKGDAKCDFATLLPRDVDWPRTCPQCGAKTKSATNDSIEYAWFEWGPHITQGGWSILQEPARAA